MAKEMQWKRSHVDFFDEFTQCILLSLVLTRWRHAVQYENHQFLKFAQKIFIFAQNLEKFAQKQNMPKFWKNLPNFQKLPNTCSPALFNFIVAPPSHNSELFTQWKWTQRKKAPQVTDLTEKCFVHMDSQWRQNLIFSVPMSLSNSPI